MGLVLFVDELYIIYISAVLVICAGLENARSSPGLDRQQYNFSGKGPFTDGQ